MGVVFDIKRYAIHDGPGIRTTIFLKGCPLDCPWCHNPEGKKPQPELMWWSARCLGCRSCVEACPREALTLEAALTVDQERCDLCGACAEACTTEALEIVGHEATVEEIMKEIRKDAVFYEESGGGVTFSGGEPTMQAGFLRELLRACKEEGFHTAVDTSGNVDPVALLILSDYIDLFLYDIKTMDEEIHRDHTGTSNRLILENMRRLSNAGKSVIVRMPLIPGFNDDEENARKTGEFVSSLATVKQICILPYHKGGTEKLGRLMETGPYYETEPPEDEKIGEIKGILEEYGLEVKIGG